MTADALPTAALPQAPAARMHAVRRLALLGALLMLATVGLSAYMRLAQAGHGCDDWPSCYGRALQATPTGAAPEGSTGVALARLAHRVVASGALLLAVALVGATLVSRPRLPREAALALALLALALGLALLGLMTSGARLPAVMMGNLLGGFLMLALCARLADASAAARLGWPAWCVAALVFAQTALGALVSGSHAALSCAGWSDCSAAVAAAGWDWHALDPWARPGLEALPPFNAAGAAAQFAHRAGALLVAPLLVGLGAAALRRGRVAEGAAVLVLVGAQLAIGLLALDATLPLAAVLAHNLAAALLLALAVRLA